MPKNLKALKNENGITGLETAIILIAFVIVASVLSYVVISAGLFSSQKAKEAVNSGISQTGATVELKGNVVVQMQSEESESEETTTTVATAAYAYLTIGLVPGGTEVDLSSNPPPGWVDDGTTPTPDGSTPTATSFNNMMVISYSDSTQQVPSLYWTVEFINNNSGDNMLDASELAQITVYLDKDWYPEYMTDGLEANTTFNLDVTPGDGSVLPIERKLPSRISGLINLH